MVWIIPYLEVCLAPEYCPGLAELFILLSRERIYPVLPATVLEERGPAICFGRLSPESMELSRKAAPLLHNYCLDLVIMKLYKKS